MRSIRIETKAPYDVMIGGGLMEKTGRILSSLRPGRRAAVITDDTVEKLYGGTVMESLRTNGLEPVLFSFAHGEQQKNMGTLTDALCFMAGNGITRGDLVVALGGGVPGDLAGFAAAVYCRGMDFAQVPTTLLAAVDSSVGGKTAVDLPQGKNMAGAFHQPIAVICDTDVLRRLPGDLVRDGSAEILKYGMLTDEGLFDTLARGDWLPQMEDVVARCVSIKRDYVLKDEHDRGVRQYLNLGHTFGHAVEKLSGFTLTHGQAVGMGLLMAARAAGIDHTPVKDALLSLRLAPEAPYGADELARAALSDKKREGGSITLVLPERIGACYLKKVPVSSLPEWFRKGKGE